MLEKSTIPEGSSGDWRVEHFSISEKEASLHAIRCSLHPGMASRSVEPGTYTKLTRSGRIIMSDTPAELSDHWNPVHEATGHVLINGLGLGLVVQNILQKPEVTDITVIEISPDVVNIVSQYIQDSRLTIIIADAFSWRPPKNKRYQVVWHDIWDDICVDNLDGMKTLHRRYGRRTDWQGSWRRGLCEMYRRWDSGP